MADRVFWIESYLSNDELSAVIYASDVILLNYAESFTSQSGIFNLTIPFRKPVVVSSGKSGMAGMVKEFQLGNMVEGGGVSELMLAIRAALGTAKKEENWENYQQYASWENNAHLGFIHFQGIAEAGKQ